MHVGTLSLRVSVREYFSRFTPLRYIIIYLVELAARICVLSMAPRFKRNASKCTKASRQATRVHMLGLMLHPNWVLDSIGHKLHSSITVVCDVSCSFETPFSALIHQYPLLILSIHSHRPGCGWAWSVCTLKLESPHRCVEHVGALRLSRASSGPIFLQLVLIRADC